MTLRASDRKRHTRQFVVLKCLEGVDIDVIRDETGSVICVDQDSHAVPCVLANCDQMHTACTACF